MLTHLPTLQRLVRHLQRVPYLASKNLYRVADYFLKSDAQTLEQFCQVLLDAKKKICACQVCYNWAEGNQLCAVCCSPRRDTKLICVVETWLDVVAIEKTGGYNGVYHVLGGALCPLDGIGPAQLTIAHLLERLANHQGELIFATNPTPEGEATASFISAKIKNNDITISRLASGVPTGSSLEQMDRITIHKALSGRRPF